ncbi:hypothetical protein HHL21_19020 [Massilia sp. RP-1-19]|uniref:Uncharacterized protein n=1 Tax=Massilia polaris TaxID=2728846 RepID=A0A848HP64_9BURK|nr:hypothetical protein [Massilia polaris]NML63135.1 hypothetical protein [Massilia polaris]
MSVNQDSDRDFNTAGDLAGTTCADAHGINEQSALSRAAHIAAKFVIARWQDGSRRHCANLNLPHSQSARACWYAKTQQGLQDWIARGGFSQPVDAHDAAALAGSGATRPILYRLNAEDERCDRSCVG